MSASFTSNFIGEAAPKFRIRDLPLFGRGTCHRTKVRPSYLHKYLVVKLLPHEMEFYKELKILSLVEVFFISRVFGSVNVQESGVEHNIELESGNLCLSPIRIKEGRKLENCSVSFKMPPRSAQIRLVSCHPEVYEPCDDSFALVDALLADRTNLLAHQPTICMEVGCGSGYVITSLALMLGQEDAGLHYFATDINPHAVRVTCETMEAHGVHAEVICGDIASGLERRLGGLVDVLVVNPPYVPTPEDEVGREGIASAWAGGENGRVVIDRILPIADKLLSEHGWLYLVTLTANNPLQICVLMREKGYASQIVVQRSTEEESLHVIKLWRDAEVLREAKEPMARNRATPAVMDYLLSQFPCSSFWKTGGSSSNNG